MPPKVKMISEDLVFLLHDSTFRSWPMATFQDLTLLVYPLDSERPPSLRAAHPDRSPNAISHRTVSDVVNGSPSYTTVYPASNTTSFDLQSLSYACVVLSEAGRQHTILMHDSVHWQQSSGRANDDAVAYLHAVCFGDAEVESFTEGSFGSESKGLKNVTIQDTNSTTTPATTVMYFNNVKYMAHIKAY